MGDLIHDARSISTAARAPRSRSPEHALFNGISAESAHAAGGSGIKRLIFAQLIKAAGLFVRRPGA
jgi:hypothetical protein